MSAGDDGRDGERRGPDPERPGTVYRSRPRWVRAITRADEPPARRSPVTVPEERVGVGAPRSPAAPRPPGTGRGPAAPRGAAAPRGTARPPLGAPPYAPGGSARRRPGLGRVRWRWVVVAVVALLVAYPVALFTVAWRSLARVDALPAGGRVADTPGTTYLVVGSDSRSDLSRAERARLGTGQAAGRRTDTIILLHVPDGGGPTVLVSVPRDSYVSIPGRGKNKINASYAFGGPQLLVRTVEEATGLHVDDYVETGLGGYADLVDAVGGVDVCVKRAIQDEKAHIDLPKGCQTLDGKDALGYARARYSDPRGDLGRVERQRQVLAAIAGKTLSPAVVLLPWRAFPAAGAGGHALTVDESTSPLGLFHFITAMRNVAGGGGLSLTVPVARGDLRTPAGEAVEWNSAKASALFTALRSDDTEAIRPLAEEQKKAAG